MKKNGKFIEYICPKCKTKENIPTEIVKMLNEADSFGVDLSEPPKFNCEKYPEKIVPIYYISVHGKYMNISKNNIFFLCS